MDPAKFERLVDEHKDAVYRQMLRVCDHREDAEDALATALLQAFIAADSLKSSEAFRIWIGTIGRHVCARMRSNPKIDSALQFALDNDLLSRNGDEMDAAVLKSCVQGAFQNLPVIYQDVYRLCELEEATVGEAAEALGISLAAAKSRLFRARALVREHLDQSICGA